MENHQNTMKSCDSELPNQDQISTQQLNKKHVDFLETDFEWWWLQQKQNSELLKRQCQSLISAYSLNPLLGELKIILQDHSWIPHITMDGWMKMINQHPAFCGIDFLESTELIEGIPAWMSCTIYRHDRVIAITVKEYYLELKTEGLIWEEIPRRLLRFRALQQCARLALGLSSPEFSASLTDHIANTSCHQLKKVATTISSMEILKQHLQPRPINSPTNTHGINSTSQDTIQT